MDRIGKLRGTVRKLAAKLKGRRLAFASVFSCMSNYRQRAGRLASRVESLTMQRDALQKVIEPGALSAETIARFNSNPLVHLEPAVAIRIQAKCTRCGAWASKAYVNGAAVLCRSCCEKENGGG